MRIALLQLIVRQEQKRSELSVRVAEASAAKMLGEGKIREVEESFFF